MKLTCHSLIASTTSLLILYVGLVYAGPTEDYTEGIKRYAAGDMVGAMSLLTRAADAGNAAAQARIGEILDEADADEEAIKYFRKSAAQGNADGQFDLGVMLMGGAGAPQSLGEARKWIVLAAEQGHKAAISALAHAYINGGLDIPESARQSAEALRWIRAAADDGNLPAMEKLAIAYRSGELGLSIDLKAAEQWAERIRKTSDVPKGRRNKRSKEK